MERGNGKDGKDARWALNPARRLDEPRPPTPQEPLRAEPVRATQDAVLDPRSQGGIAE